jgi:hypothetical protein
LNVDLTLVDKVEGIDEDKVGAMLLLLEDGVIGLTDVSDELAANEGMPEELP